MDCPDDLRYTADHEWIRRDGDEATLGITEFACEQLGDVVFVELPNVGSTLTKGAAFGVIESVKAVYDLFAPASGQVVGRNESLLDAPEAVNHAPYGDGWMVRIRLSDPAELDGLMDAAAYRVALAGD